MHHLDRMDAVTNDWVDSRIHIVKLDECLENVIICNTADVIICATDADPTKESPPQPHCDVIKLLDLVIIILKVNSLWDDDELGVKGWDANWRHTNILIHISTYIYIFFQFF
jgi:hypothetical protein